MASTLSPTVQGYLNLIAQYESGNQNIPNYRYDPTHTAQGYYQITNTNWLNVAPQLGIDTSLYPNAMSAPQDVQAQVAAYLLTQTPAGISNWANYNPNLMSALTSAGLQTSGQVSDPSSWISGALVDLTGSAAATSTSDIMTQLGDMASSAGIDLTNPTTDIVLAVAAAAVAYLVLS